MKNTATLKNQHTEFKFSIFKEGMRQLRVGGIVFAILCFAAALICSLEGFNYTYEFQYQVSIINITPLFENVLVTLALLIAVFVFGAALYIMHFLRSSKARDFYCSTPSSICTIWLGFTAAVFTWTAIGIGATAIVGLPFLLISDIRTFGLWALMLISMLAFALFLCGIIMLAISLTGKLIPAIITALGIAILPSMLWLSVNSTFYGFFSVFGFWSEVDTCTFFDPIYVLLSAILPGWNYYYYSISTINMFDVFCSASTIVYCFILGAFYLAVAVLFMTIRTGDSVGKPFVNKAAHVISLIAVATDVASFIGGLTVFVISDISLFKTYYFDNNNVLSIAVTLLIAAACTAVCYWLCELVLTFDIKKSYRMLKFMPVPFAVVIALTGCGYLFYSAEFNYTPNADEVESFTLVRNQSLDNNLAVFRMNGTYGRLVTNETKFKDQEIINYVTKEINDFIALYKNDVYKAIDNSPYYTDEGSPINIRLNMKNGKTITRTIPYDKAFSKKLADAMSSDTEYLKNFLALPDAKYTNINVSANGFSREEALEVYESFKSEYDAMTYGQKLEYLKRNVYNNYNKNGYYDENDGSYFIDSEEDYEETEEISYTDLTLADKSTEAGDFSISSSLYIQNVGFNFTSDIDLSINGYKDGKLYNENFSFNQTYNISLNAFPKTKALIIKLCNNKLSEFVDIKNQLTDYSRLTINADYYNGKDNIFISYEYTNKSDAEFINQIGVDEYYGYYWSENKVIDVDSTQLVNKLFEDAATTTEIDLNKPYCKVNVIFYKKEINKPTFSRTLFIQTESPLDILNIERP